MQRVNVIITTSASLTTGCTACLIIAGISPKYVAVGGEDGHVYIFDTRKFAGAHVVKIAAVPEHSQSMAKSPITDVAFRPKARSMKLQLIAASLDGHLFEFGT